jgi:hypothetical protein
MLGLPFDSGVERQLAALFPEARAFRTTETVRALIGSLAEERPVVVAIEDLHWADAASMREAVGLRTACRAPKSGSVTPRCGGTRG